MVSVSSPGSGVIGAIGIGWYGAGGLAADGLAPGAATPGTTFRNRLPISFSPATPAAAAVTAVPAAAATNLRLLMTVIGSSAVSGLQLSDRSRRAGQPQQRYHSRDGTDHRRDDVAGPALRPGDDDER